MNQFNSDHYKSDGSTDNCPTCGAQARTRATSTAGQSTYAHACVDCPWSVPLSRPAQQTILTDGGQSQSQSAQDLLDQLHHDEHVQAFMAFLGGRETDIEAYDIIRTLALSDGDLCLIIEHKGKTEYLKLLKDEIGFMSKTIHHEENKEWNVRFHRRDLENRLSKPMDIELTANTPIGGQA